MKVRTVMNTSFYIVVDWVSEAIHRDPRWLEEGIMRLKRISLFLLLFGLSFGLVLGQGDKAVVVGTVSDTTGGIIPGAEVTLTRDATNEVLTNLTGSTGDYAFRALPAGVYSLRASLPGFKTDERTGMKLDTGQIYRIDIVLSVGEVSEVVSVVSTAPILETEEPELNQVLTSEVAVNLPLNTRDVLIMGTLTPGISPSRNSQGGGMGYVVKGMRRADNLVTLDGSMVSETNGGIVMRGNPDAIAEFEIKTGLYGAQYGIKPGGHFSMITKSGTNDLHGAAFWFHRNDNLDARNFFSGTPPERKRNQYGASAGGPIVLPGLFDGRDKAWWFFSYSSELIRGERTFTGLVPTPAERSGVFADTIMDPSTGAPFPNNTIPSARFDSVTQKMISLYPSPNADISQGFNLVNNSSSPTDIEEYIVKMDFRTGPDSRWSGPVLLVRHPDHEGWGHSNLHSDRPASELRSEHYQYAKFRRQRGQRGRPSLLPKAVLSWPALGYGSELLKQPGHRRLADQGPGF